MANQPIQTLTIETRQRTEFQEVTTQVADVVKRLGVADGYAIVYVPHTTAGATINENADPSVRSDLLAKLDRLIPQIETYYEHDEGNSDAHLKTALTGNSVTVFIENGKLQLGRWQGIYFCEYDGPRERRMLVKVVRTD